MDLYQELVAALKDDEPGSALFKVLKIAHAQGVQKEEAGMALRRLREDACLTGNEGGENLITEILDSCVEGWGHLDYRIW